MKLKDTFMSGPICVKIFEISMYSEKFPFAFQTIFFSQLQLANNFFYEKGNPRIKK